ncbi:MAG TPA: glycosyltransferase family 39 protein [Candidatus Koribacter sp.]|jgi:4-amino-4-deoxy-L-arabinose transferase-like glycosyltransferase
MPSTTPAPPEPQSRQRNLYILLFAAAFLLRMACMFWWKSYNFHSDPPYTEIGRLIERLATGHGFSAPYGGETGPTAAFPPVYPFIGSLIYRIFGYFGAPTRIALLTFNCLMGAFNAVLIQKLGVRTLGRRAGWLAAWCWALFPVFFRWDISWIWEFSLSALVLTWVFILTMDLCENGTRARWAGFGAAWGFASLANPALVSLLPFSGLYAAARNHRAGRRWFTNAVISAVLFFAVLSPWLIRNYEIFHKVFFVRDNFWLEFQLGNYHGTTALGFFRFHPTGNYKLLQRFGDLGEMGYMEDRKKLAMDFIHKYPIEFRDATIRRVQWFWDGTSVIYQSNEWWSPWEVWWLSVLSGAGLVFVLTRRPPGWILFLACMLIYPLPYYITYANAKYRHPIEPELILMGAYFVFVVWDEIVKLRARNTT